MPSRNIVKEYAADSFYHIYNRGVEKRDIFMDEQDYSVFLGLIKKYLTGINNNKNNRHKSEPLAKEVKILAYCLMPSHFHLLVHQSNPSGATKLMRKLSTGYVMYFNNRHRRIGGLFQGTFKASLIENDEYLEHVSRYIHLNPDGEYKNWPYSSIRNYTGEKRSEWLDTKTLLDQFGGDGKSYLEFIEDYHLTKRELNLIKWQLANDIEA